MKKEETLIKKNQELYESTEITKKDIVDIVFKINDEERKELEKETKNYYETLLPFIISNYNEFNEAALSYYCKNYSGIFDGYNFDLRDKYILILKILEYAGHNGLELIKNMKEKSMREGKTEFSEFNELPELLPEVLIRDIRKILYKLIDKVKIVKYRGMRDKKGHIVYFYRINEDPFVKEAIKKLKKEILENLKKALNKKYICYYCGCEVKNGKFTNYLCPFDGIELIKPEFEEGSYLRKIVEKKIELFEKELNN